MDAWFETWIAGIVLLFLITHSILFIYTYKLSALTTSQKEIEASCDDSPMEKETLRYNINTFVNGSRTPIISYSVAWGLAFLTAAGTLLWLLYSGTSSTNWTSWSCPEADQTKCLIRTMLAIIIVLLLVQGAIVVDAANSQLRPLAEEYDPMFDGALYNTLNDMRDDSGTTKLANLPLTLSKKLTHRVLSENPSISSTAEIERLLQYKENAKYIPMKDYLSFKLGSTDVSEIFANRFLESWNTVADVKAASPEKWNAIKRRIQADSELKPSDKSNVEAYFNSLLAEYWKSKSQKSQDNLMKYIQFPVNIPALDIQQVGSIKNIYDRMADVLLRLQFATWIGVAFILFVILHPIYKANYSPAIILAIFAILFVTMAILWISISFSA